MFNKLSVVENPGRGDCAYFSFGAALVPHLQQELAKDEADRPLLNTLLSSFDEGDRAIFLEQVRAFKFDAIDEDFYWNVNIVLRRLLYHSRIKELDIEFNDEFTDELVIPPELIIAPKKPFFLVALYRKFFGKPAANVDNPPPLEPYRKYTKFALKSSILFSDAMGIFWHMYDKKPLNDAANNEFNRDRLICSQISQVVRLVKSKEATLGRRLSDLEKGFYVRTALFTDLKNPADGANQFSNNSLVAKNLEQRSLPGAWGTENDLRVIAEELDVCLILHHRGKQGFTPRNDTRPVVRVNHATELHWNTIFAEPAPPPAPVAVSVPLSTKSFFSKNKWKLLGITAFILLGGTIGAGLFLSGVAAPFGVGLFGYMMSVVVGLTAGGVIGGMFFESRLESTQQVYQQPLPPQGAMEPYFPKIGMGPPSGKKFSVPVPRAKVPSKTAIPRSATPTVAVQQSVQGMAQSSINIASLLVEVNKLLVPLGMNPITVPGQQSPLETNSLLGKRSSARSA